MKLRLPVLSILLITAVFFWYWQSFPDFFAKSGTIILSPLVANGKTLNSAGTGSCWKPEGSVTPADTAPLTEAKGIMLIDFDNRKVIYQKSQDKAYPVASLTKLMTAIVALQIGRQDRELEVSTEATTQGEAAVGLLPGEKLTRDELLWGMLLNSGNDAAEVLALTIAGGRNDFIGLMNQKANNLCLKQTKFVNPTGLDEPDGSTNTSSAYDLAALYYYGFHNFPLFREIETSFDSVLPESPTHRRYFLTSTAWKFTANYPHILGGKTGDTNLAGYCLVALAEKNSQRLLLVVLGEPSYNSIRKDSWQLFEYGFKELSQ